MFNTQKYGKSIWVRTHPKSCVHSSHTTKSQAASSTALLNYPKIFPLKIQQNIDSENIFTIIRNSVKLFICLYTLSTWC